MNWNLVWPVVFGLIWGAYFAHVFYSNKIEKLKKEFSKSIPLPEIPSPCVERHLVPMKVKKMIYLSSFMIKPETGYNFAARALAKDLVDDMQSRVSAELSIVIDESSKE